ncbi:hypothetical protein BHE74_00038670 [Ensete ventricosum]|nr:hypothetical protein BHE74_00038670 [Ensete ventricosum]
MCRGSSWDDEFLTTIVELYIVIEESTWLSFVCVCKLVRINREALRSRKRLIGPTRGRASDSFSRSVERSCTNASSGWGALCSPPDDQVNASIESSFPVDQVGMVSPISSSSSTSSFSTSLVSLPPAEEVRSTGSTVNQPELSSSSSALTSMDIGAIKALEVMKSCHDCDSVLSA